MGSALSSALPDETEEMVTSSTDSTPVAHQQQRQLSRSGAYDMAQEIMQRTAAPGISDNNQMHQHQERQQHGRTQQQVKDDGDDGNKQQKKRRDKNKERRIQQRRYPKAFIVQPRVPSGLLRSPRKSDILRAIESLVKTPQEGKQLYTFLRDSAEATIQKIRSDILLSLNDNSSQQEQQLALNWKDLDKNLRDHAINILIRKTTTATATKNDRCRYYIPLHICENLWIARFLLLNKWDDAVAMEQRGRRRVAMSALVAARQRRQQRQQQLVQQRPGHHGRNTVIEHHDQQHHHHYEVSAVRSTIAATASDEDEMTTRSDGTNTSCYFGEEDDEEGQLQQQRQDDTMDDYYYNNDDKRYNYLDHDSSNGASGSNR